MRNLLLVLSLFVSEISFAGKASPCSMTGALASRSENLLSALSQVPTPAFMVLEQAGSARFVSPAQVYADVLDTSDKSLIINDIEELRFLSQTLAHSEILMVLKGKADIDGEKAKKVLSVAKLLDIKLSLVWLGEMSSPKALRDLVAESGGRSFETRDLLQKAEEICQESLAGR